MTACDSCSNVGICEANIDGSDVPLYCHCYVGQVRHRLESALARFWQDGGPENIDRSQFDDPPTLEAALELAKQDW